MMSLKVCRGGVVSTMVILAGAVSACSADTTAPTEVRGALRTSASDAPEPRQNGQKRIELKGEAFVLDTDSRAIYYGNGKKIGVPQMQLKKAEQFFEMVSRYDAAIAATESDASYRKCLAEAKRLGVKTKLAYRKESKDESSIVRNSLSFNGEISTKNPRFTYGETYGGQSCLELSQAMYQATQRWRGYKDQMHDIIVQSGFAGLTIGLFTYQFSEITAFSYMVTNLLDLEMDMYDTLIEMNVLGAMMHFQNCIYGDAWQWQGTNPTQAGNGFIGDPVLSGCTSEWGALYLVWEDGAEEQIWSGYVWTCNGEPM